MPANKWALLRYHIINSKLNKVFPDYPSKEELRLACEDELYGTMGKHISTSTIEKDISVMKHDKELGLYAPIEYSREYKGYFYSDPNYILGDLVLGDSVKRSDLKYGSIAEEFSDNLWTSLQMIRGVTPADDYHLVLFLLHIFNAIDFTEEGHDANHPVNRIEDYLTLAYPDSTNITNQVYAKVYDNIFFNMPADKLSALLTFIGSVDREVFVDNYAEIFDQTFYKITEISGRSSIENSLPVEISRLVLGLADFENASSIFNPFAGFGSFGTLLNENATYLGQEINLVTWAIGSMRIMAHHNSSNIEIEQANSITNWPRKETKFDLILSSPPFGVKISQEDRFLNPQIETFEHFLIEKGLESLTENGKLIAVLPEGFLAGKGPGMSMRKFLVDSDLIEAIVSLPGGLLSSTAIPVNILVINKQKPLKGKVKFIYGDGYVESESKKNTLNERELLAVVRSSVKSKAVKIIPTRKIQSLNYSLYPLLYSLEDFEGTLLAKVLTKINKRKELVPINGKMIKIGDLKDDPGDFNLDILAVPRHTTRSKVQKIEESCILLATRGKSLKPTFFNYQGSPLFITAGILAYSVDELLVNVPFLIRELHQDYIQLQTGPYRIGTRGFTIRPDDVPELKIKLPSLLEQKARIKALDELSGQIKSIENDKINILSGLENKALENYSSIKHSLGKPLLNIGSSISSIEKTLSKNYEDWQLLKLNDHHEFTLKDFFQSVYENLDFVHSILKNNVNERLDFSKYSLADLDFIKFIKNYVKNVKAADRKSVKTTLEIHPDFKTELGRDALVKADPELLKIALNVIVENANRHAFTDDSKKFVLAFRVSIVVHGSEEPGDAPYGRFDRSINVEVANTGTPFKENFGLENLIRKNVFAGENGNTGQGGYDLNEIVKYLNNGQSTLRLGSQDFLTDFVTSYAFRIGIIN